MVFGSWSNLKGTEGKGFGILHGGLALIANKGEAAWAEACSVFDGRGL